MFLTAFNGLSFEGSIRELQALRGAHKSQSNTIPAPLQSMPCGRTFSFCARSDGANTRTACAILVTIRFTSSTKEPVDIYLLVWRWILFRSFSYRSLHCHIVDCSTRRKELDHQARGVPRSTTATVGLIPSTKNIYLLADSELTLCSDERSIPLVARSHHICWHDGGKLLLAKRYGPIVVAAATTVFGLVYPEVLHPMTSVNHT